MSGSVKRFLLSMLASKLQRRSHRGGHSGIADGLMREVNHRIARSQGHHPPGGHGHYGAYGPPGAYGHPGAYGPPGAYGHHGHYKHHGHYRQHHGHYKKRRRW